MLENGDLIFVKDLSDMGQAIQAYDLFIRITLLYVCSVLMTNT